MVGHRKSKRRDMRGLANTESCCRNKTYWSVGRDISRTVDDFYAMENQLFVAHGNVTKATIAIEEFDRSVARSAHLRAKTFVFLKSRAARPTYCVKNWFSFWLHTQQTN